MVEAKAEEEQDPVETLLNQHDSRLANQHTQISDLIKTILEMQNQLEDLTARVTVLVPDPKRVPPEMAAGVTIGQVYLAAIQGGCAGVFGTSPNVTNQLKNVDYRRFLSEHILQFAGDVSEEAMSRTGKGVEEDV